MLLTICKSCQYCLETMYWNCCEERFCFDKKIASYRIEESSPNAIHTNGLENTGPSFDSVVVTSQPSNNNHLPPNAIYDQREVNELPFNAGALYEVFSKSMVFRQDHELKSSEPSQDSLEECETKSEPDYLSDKPNRTKVYFEDEVNSPVTDFEIMFKDELLYNHITKIDEEDEVERRSDDLEDGLVMNVAIKKQNVIKPSTITKKDEPKMTTTSQRFEYDPSIAVPTLKTALSLPRVESRKGILRQNRELPRSVSAKVLCSQNSVSLISKPSTTNAESMIVVDPDRINKVLRRLPHKSASFLNIPEYLIPAKPPLTKSKSALGVLSLDDDGNKLSRLPDTPIIKSNNLPRFFTDSPTVMEYKADTSLQSIQEKESLKFQEDLSMPRYYGKTPNQVDPVPVHESKSMPDLRSPTPTEKVSKRLVKIRSRLKPLVIKKGAEERL